MVLLQLDLFATYNLLLVTHLSVEHVVQVVVETLLITSTFVLHMHLQSHSFI